jgi:hypothetical protein
LARPDHPHIPGEPIFLSSADVESSPEPRGGSEPVLFLTSPGLVGYVLLGDDV